MSHESQSQPYGAEWLEPGLKTYIPANSEPLLNIEEVKENFPLGFEASLRGVIALGAHERDDQSDQLFLFDRGPDASFASVADTDTEKTNMSLSGDERFVIITSEGLSFLQDARDNNWSVKSHHGWLGVKLGDYIVVGRNDEFEDKFNVGFKSTTSRRHAEIKFETDGQIAVTDLGSTNGTRLVASSTDMPAVPVNIEAETIESSFSLDQTAAISLSAIAGAVEREKSREKLDGLEVGIAEKPRRGEDTILASKEWKVFGVFDGLGGMADGKQASEKAARCFLDTFAGRDYEAHTVMNEISVKNDLIGSFNFADQVVSRYTNGASTGVVTKIYEKEDGNKLAVWASVGDSRMYVYNNSSKSIAQITHDETVPGRPNVLTNCIGGECMRVEQSGIVELKADDKIILCSDGITGDYGGDILSDKELVQAMTRATDNQDAADKILQMSRKQDDKSVIVIS